VLENIFCEFVSFLSEPLITQITQIFLYRLAELVSASPLIAGNPETSSG